MTEPLNELREQISKIDSDIFSKLVERFELVKQVGEYKKTHQLPIRNQERELDLIEKMTRQNSLDANFVAGLYQLIFNYSYKLEQ